MKRKLFSKPMALMLALLLLGTMLPLAAGAEAGVSQQVTMTYAYTNDPNVATEGNIAPNINKTIDGNENSYYQPAQNIEGLYIVYSLADIAAVNHVRIRQNAVAIANGSFSLYYTDRAYTEGQNDEEINWLPLLENAAPYLDRMESFGFDTAWARQIKLTINTNRASRPVIREIALSSLPFKTSYHVDIKNHKIMNIPIAESDVAAVRSKLSAVDGYRYTIYSRFEGVDDPGNTERTEGNIGASDVLIVWDAEGGFVEEYTFLLGSESTILRSDALADYNPKGNTNAFSIDVGGSKIHQVPKSFTASRLISVLEVEHPGIITILQANSQPIMEDEIASGYRVRVTPENGIGYKDYIIQTVASSYNTSTLIPPGKPLGTDTLYWDDEQTTLWFPDNMTIEKFRREINKPAGGSVAFQNAEGEEVTTGALTTGMKLVSTAESGNEAFLTAPPTNIYPIMVDYALRKTATTTTGHYASAPPAYAVDGIKTTGYIRYLGFSALEGDLTIDLGASKTVDTVSLKLQNPNTAVKVLPDEFKVLVSNDEVTFTEVCSYGTRGTPLDNETDLFAAFRPIEARYVKLLITNNSVLPEGMGKAALRVSNVSVFDSSLRTSAALSLWQNDMSIESFTTGDVTAKAALTAEGYIPGVTFKTATSLIVAVYQGDRLSRVLIKPLVLTAGSAEPTDSETISLQAEDTEVTAFLWDADMSDMKPLCAPKRAGRSSGE